MKVSAVSPWTDSLSRTFDDLVFKMSQFLPSLIVAAFVFLIGLLIADIAAEIVRQILKRAKIDDVVKKIGLTKLVQDAGFDFSVTNLTSWLVKWFIILVFLIAVADNLGLPQVAQFINQVAEYLPSVIAAAVILTIGVTVANIVSELVTKASKRAKLASAGLVSAITKWSILVFVFLAVLSQLQIASALVETLFTGIVFALALALGLSFGLGGKEHASRAIEHLVKEVGKKI